MLATSSEVHKVVRTMQKPYPYLSTFAQFQRMVWTVSSRHGHGQPVGSVQNSTAAIPDGPKEYQVKYNRTRPRDCVTAFVEIPKVLQHKRLQHCCDHNRPVNPCKSPAIALIDTRTKRQSTDCPPKCIVDTPKVLQAEELRSRRDHDRPVSPVREPDDDRAQVEHRDPGGREQQVRDAHGNDDEHQEDRAGDRPVLHVLF
jgi:hypothetical protein